MSHFKSMGYFKFHFSQKNLLKKKNVCQLLIYMSPCELRKVYTYITWCTLKEGITDGKIFFIDLMPCSWTKIVFKLLTFSLKMLMKDWKLSISLPRPMIQSAALL